MKRNHFVLLVALLLLCAAGAWAQASLTLSQAAAAPKVDGTIAAKEYALTTDVSGIQVNLSWSADTLYVGVVGKTTGWVAIGFGSTVMDKAVMYIGFMGGDKTQLKVQVGAEHNHGDTDKNAPIEYKMTEANGQTVLELALAAGGFIAKGQKELEMIVAIGGSDSFLALHRTRGKVSVSLAQ